MFGVTILKNIIYERVTMSENKVIELLNNWDNTGF